MSGTSGNVGIGTASPTAKLDVQVSAGFAIVGSGAPGFLGIGGGIWAKGPIGVLAQGTSTGIIAAGGSGGAGQFQGNVSVSGKPSKTGGGFTIDHPTDPENRYLSHSFVESPEMLNVYRGTVTTDQEGAATVELPGYVAALNREFSYHLTVVGDFARAVVSAPLRDGRLSLRTDQPGVTVCWLVLGVRADPWAEANPIEVERDKPDDERNLFLHPELYDQPPARGLLHSKYRPCANRPDPRPSGRRDAGQRACASSSFLRGAVGGRAVVGWVQALALAVADFAGGIGFGGRAVSAQGGVDGAKPG